MWYPLTANDIHKIHGSYKTRPDIFQAFVEANGWNRYTRPGAQDYKRFLTYGRDTFGYPHIITECPPGMDHARAFKNTRTGVVCLVTQPYDCPDDLREELKEWAKQRGLESEVYDSSHSWYYPGYTCVAVLHLPGVEIKLR